MYKVDCLEPQAQLDHKEQLDHRAQLEHRVQLALVPLALQDPKVPQARLAQPAYKEQPAQAV